MNFVENGSVSDFGAPEYCVTGIARIDRISAGQVRISKYSRRPDDNVIVFHEVWDWETWLQTVRIVDEVRATIMAERPPQHGANRIELQ